MSKTAQLARLLRRWLPRDRRVFEGELADELSFHVRARADELRRTGLTPEEAERRARLELGGTERCKDDMRDLRPGRWLEHSSHELAAAVRSLARSPGYLAATVVVYGVAMAAGSAVFGVVDFVLLRPLPIRAPQELVVGWERNPSRDQAVVEVSYRNVQDWQTGSRAVADVSAFGSSAWSLTLEDRGDPTRIASVGVTWRFFHTLGAQPFLGRFFEAEDDRPNPIRPLVLSHRFWQARFGGDVGVVGSRVETGDGPARIVGIAPPDLDFPRGVDAWLPVGPVLAGTRGIDGFRDIGVLFLMARLRPGVSQQAATLELDRVATDAAGQGALRFGSTVQLTPLLDYQLGPVRSALWWLAGGVAVLIAIACGNLAALLLARAVGRQREQAVRLALGASRLALWRRWSMESALIALLGGTVGMIGARWLIAAIRRLAPAGLPHVDQLVLSPAVSWGTFAALFVMAVAASAVPVVLGADRSILGGLAEGARATDGRRAVRLRGLLLTGQVALSVALLMAAGLIVRSYANVRALDLGFVPDKVIALEVDSRLGGQAHNDWVRELLQRMSALPGVEAAGAVHVRPLLLGAIGSDSTVVLEGQPDSPESGRLNPLVNVESATPGYFATMGIRLVEGRLFDENDHGMAPRVALVSRSAARRLWPGRSAVGQRLSRPSLSRGASGNQRTVVGVVEDVRYRGIEDVRLDLYEPAAQSNERAGSVIVRTREHPVATAAAVEAEVRRLAPRAIVTDVTTMQAVVGRATASWTLSTWMFGLFALAAVALVGAGLFSSVTLDSARRSHELALRRALGALPHHLARIAASTTGMCALVGAIVGLLLGTAAARAMAHLLFEVSPVDLFTYVAVACLVGATVLAAAFRPLSRAVRADPASVLRAS